MPHYDLGDAPPAEPPAPCDPVLTRAMWDGAVAFARDLGFDLFVTPNAGPGPRDADGAWTPDDARRLLTYAAAQGAPVRLRELGPRIAGRPCSGSG